MPLPSHPAARATRKTTIFAVLLATAFTLMACTAKQALTGQPAYDSTLSAAQTQALQDWKIRAGLYASNDAPSALPYVPDSGLSSWTGQCQATLDGLAQFAPGLLATHDAPLAKAARAFDAAVRQRLQACIQADAVGLHHGEAAMKVAAADVNTRYARLLGYDPTLYNAPKAL